MREHDVRYIRACHGSDQHRDEREQKQERLDLSAELLDERTDDDAGLRVGIRVLSLEPTGDPGEIRFSLRSGHAWLESRGDEQPPFVACVAYGVEWQCHE